MRDIIKYQELANRTASTRPDNYMNFTLGLAGETGEIVDYIKKVAFQGHKLDKEKLKYEFGDCFWYLVNLAKELEIDLDDVLESNIEKLKERYPYGFDEYRSVNRKD